MAKIEAQGCDTTTLGIAEMFLEKPSLPAGEFPWLVCTKAWSWRFGPNSWSLPGVGCWVMPTVPNCFLIVFKAADFINQGVVALGDLSSFLESNTGQSMTKASMILVDMRAGRKLCWVPFGYIVAPLHTGDYDIDADDDADDKQDSEKVAASISSSSSKPACANPASTDLAYFWCMPVFSGPMSCKVSQREWAPICAFNKAHFDKASSSPLWAQRAGAFEQMCAARTT